MPGFFPGPSLSSGLFPSHDRGTWEIGLSLIRLANFFGGIHRIFIPGDRLVNRGSLVLRKHARPVVFSVAHFLLLSLLGERGGSGGSEPGGENGFDVVGHTVEDPIAASTPSGWRVAVS
jgi:hypothetical protein